MSASLRFVVEPGKTRLGWIGTGVMGCSMCSHLQTAGYQVTVFNRTRAKAQPLLDAGATWADTPKDVARASDVVFSMVGFPRDVQEVYFGPSGLLAGLKFGGVAVDMTTTSPSLAADIARRAAQRGAFAVDAPVSGGDLGARNAALSIMCGGDADIIGGVAPLLNLLGTNVTRQGGPGAGQHAKLCNQIVIAGTMIGVCESLLYAAKAGLDPAAVLGAITKGAAGSWSLENLAPRILKGDFAPGFMIDHFVKDMGIALEECRRLSLTLPGLELVEKLYRQAQEMGFGQNGTQALYLALEKLGS